MVIRRTPGKKFKRHRDCFTNLKNTLRVSHFATFLSLPGAVVQCTTYFITFPFKPQIPWTDYESMGPWAQTRFGSVV